MNWWRLEDAGRGCGRLRGLPIPGDRKGRRSGTPFRGPGS
jgi:hypothetical protein